MDKTMFELNLFENVKKDILDTPIEEGTQEFETKCPSMNPEEHFDKDASGDRKVTTDPAEKPTAKPVDGEMGPVNSQTQTETPTAKPYDANSISVPSKATLTVDQYNQAIDQLQKSFKEGAELLAALQQATIIEEETLTEDEIAAMNTVLEMCVDKPDQMKKWASNELFYMIPFAEAYELFEEASRNAALYPGFEKDIQELSKSIHKINPDKIGDLRKVWKDFYNAIDSDACQYIGFHRQEIGDKRFNQAQLDYAGKNSENRIKDSQYGSKEAARFLREWHKDIQEFKDDILKLLPKNTLTKSKAEAMKKLYDADPERFKNEYGSIEQYSMDTVDKIAKIKVLLNKICTAMMSPGLTKNDFHTLRNSFKTITLAA